MFKRTAVEQHCLSAAPFNRPGPVILRVKKHYRRCTPARRITLLNSKRRFRLTCSRRWFRNASSSPTVLWLTSQEDIVNESDPTTFRLDATDFAVMLLRLRNVSTRSRRRVCVTKGKARLESRRMSIATPTLTCTPKLPPWGIRKRGIR